MSGRGEGAEEEEQQQAPSARSPNRSPRRGKRRRRSLASRIAASLREFFSLGGLDGDLSLDGLDLGVLVERGRRASGSGVLLGSYTVEDVERLLEETGVLPALRAYGFRAVRVRVDDTDPFVHRLVVSDDSVAGLGPGNDYLFDAFIRRRALAGPDELVSHSLEVAPRLDGSADAAAARACMEAGLGGEPLQLSFIEHAFMQNPTRRFSRGRPPLPSQRHPGLGIAPLMLAAFVSAGHVAQRDALANQPEGWHNAELYLISGWRYANPLVEALVRVLHQDLAPAVRAHGLAPVAWAVHEKRVRDTRTGEPFEWNHRHEQLFPLSKRATNFFGSPVFHSLVDEAVRANLGRFRLEDEVVQEYVKFLGQQTAAEDADDDEG